MSELTKVPKENENILGKIISDSVKRYFENDERRRAFEKWYLTSYGKPYKWERSVSNNG